VIRVLLAPLLWLLASASNASDLKVGAAAPGFEMQGSDGRVHRLETYLGKREVVLAWFPKAFTPG